MDARGALPAGSHIFQLAVARRPPVFQIFEIFLTLDIPILSVRDISVFLILDVTMFPILDNTVFPILKNPVFSILDLPVFPTLDNHVFPPLVAFHNKQLVPNKIFLHMAVKK